MKALWTVGGGQGYGLEGHLGAFYGKAKNASMPPTDVGIVLSVYCWDLTLVISP